MNGQMTPISLIALSEQVYRALLVLYPADYRRQYASQMALTFRDVSRETYYERGLAGIVFWWCATFLDLTLTVIEQRRKVKFTMSKSTLLQMSGVLMIAGGICAAVAAISQFQPDSHYSYYGVYQLVILLLTPAFLLSALGTFAIVLRYGKEAGQGGRLALITAGIGGVIIVSGVAVFTWTTASDLFWTMTMIGLYVHITSMLVFGLIHAQTPILPKFIGLPLVIALLPLLLISGVFRTSAANSADLGAFAYLIGVGAAWVVLGLAVHKHLSKPAAAVA